MSHVMITKPTSYDCEVLVRNEALNPFKPIVMTWFQVLEDYANLSNIGTTLDRDSAFRYRERPQVGFLAAAAWRAGGVALEEWDTRKGDETLQSYGRNDLWIRLGVKEWSIEAKHVRVILGKDADVSASAADIEAQLHWAQSDLPKLRTDDESKVAALFVSPILPERNSAGRAAALIEWRKTCQQVNADLTAIVLETEISHPDGRLPKELGLTLFLITSTWKWSPPPDQAK